MLRCATWLSPGIPLGLFTAVTDALAAAVGTDVRLESFTASSGPPPDDDPFRREEIDVGFLCTPSYRALRDERPSSVLPVAAPVFDDDRNGGAPVYFAELVVRDHDEATSLADLAGARIGFNDNASLSGWAALRDRLAELEASPAFATLVHTGGHRNSLAMLEAGTIDAASIDSNTLLATALPNGTRVLETWGPFPVQPVVVRASLPEATRRALTDALVTMHEDAAVAAQLKEFDVRRFVAVTEADYL